MFIIPVAVLFLDILLSQPFRAHQPNDCIHTEENQ